MNGLFQRVKHESTISSGFARQRVYSEEQSDDKTGITKI